MDWWSPRLYFRGCFRLHPLRRYQTELPLLIRQLHQIQRMSAPLRQWKPRLYRFRLHFVVIRQRIFGTTWPWYNLQRLPRSTYSRFYIAGWSWSKERVYFIRIFKENRSGSATDVEIRGLRWVDWREQVNCSSAYTYFVWVSKGAHCSWGTRDPFQRAIKIVINFINELTSWSTSHVCPLFLG